jgi:ketosteroid isomerase-like protein
MSLTMSRSLRYRLATSLLAVITAHRQVQGQVRAQREFRSAIDSLYGAIASGDSAALGRRLADDLVWLVGASGVEVTKAQLLAAASRVQEPAVHFDVDSLRVQSVGNVALVSFRRVDRRSLGGVNFPAAWLVLDVFAQRAGRWQLVRHVQTWAVAPVQPVTVDSAALQAFVGRYSVAPGYVDDVHWEGGHLVATISGYPPGGRLVPVSGSVFSPDGVGALIAFERDASGRVIGYVQGYPDGHVVRRPKLP